jgi:hypothetical protein
MIFWFWLSAPALSGFPFACIQVCGMAFALFERPNPTRATPLLNSRIVSRLDRAAIRNFSLILQNRTPSSTSMFLTNPRRRRLTVGFLQCWRQYFR